MIGLEFSIVGVGEEEKNRIVDGLMEWKRVAEEGQRRR
jgi:hypothetical protein